ncbi:hypothetical protein EXIGLDRAFT_784261 [Exidia glandulosa HHB12029]|uniref:Uncharacterized protein n=1 Tax=Exidia glandulosa HHB12029 TaxID=1314781 RepID=A0A166MKH5_EXIGL|nr:hypothetical protein EXIGLDRAFT_784261 [Exidia glandulosa HHB12029]
MLVHMKKSHKIACDVLGGPPSPPPTILPQPAGAKTAMQIESEAPTAVDDSESVAQPQLVLDTRPQPRSTTPVDDTVAEPPTAHPLQTRRTKPGYVEIGEDDDDQEEQMVDEEMPIVDEEMPDGDVDVEMVDEEDSTRPLRIRLPSARKALTAFVTADGVAYGELPRVAADTTPEGETAEHLPARLQRIMEACNGHWEGVSKTSEAAMDVLGQVSSFVVDLVEAVGTVTGLGTIRMRNHLDGHLKVTDGHLKPRAQNVFNRFLVNTSKGCTVRRRWDEHFGAKDAYTSEERKAHLDFFKQQFEGEGWMSYLELYDIHNPTDAKQPTVDSLHEVWTGTSKSIVKALEYAHLRTGGESILIMGQGRPDVSTDSSDVIVFESPGARGFLESKTHFRLGETKTIFAAHIRNGQATQYVADRLARHGVEPASLPHGLSGDGLQAAITHRDGRTAAQAAISYTSAAAAGSGALVDPTKPVRIPDGYIASPTVVENGVRLVLIKLDDDLLWSPRNVPDYDVLPAGFDQAIAGHWVEVFKDVTLKHVEGQIPSRTAWEALSTQTLALRGLRWFSSLWPLESRNKKPDGIQNDCMKSRTAAMIIRREISIVPAPQPTAAELSQLKGITPLYGPPGLVSRGQAKGVNTNADEAPPFIIAISDRIPRDTPLVKPVYWDTVVIWWSNGVVTGLPYLERALWNVRTPRPTVPTDTYISRYDPRVAGDDTDTAVVTAKTNAKSSAKTTQNAKDAKAKAAQDAKDAKAKAAQDAKDAKAKAAQEAKDAKAKAAQDAKDAKEAKAKAAKAKRGEIVTSEPENDDDINLVTSGPAPATPSKSLPPLPPRPQTPARIATRTAGRAREAVANGNLQLDWLKKAISGQYALDARMLEKLRKEYDAKAAAVQEHEKTLEDYDGDDKKRKSKKRPAEDDVADAPPPKRAARGAKKQDTGAKPASTAGKAPALAKEKATPKPPAKPAAKPSKAAVAPPQEELMTVKNFTHGTVDFDMPDDLYTKENVPMLKACYNRQRFNRPIEKADAALLEALMMQWPEKFPLPPALEDVYNYSLNNTAS